MQGYGYGAPPQGGYAPPQGGYGYGMAQGAPMGGGYGGYGGGYGGNRPGGRGSDRGPMGAEDLDRISKTIHVAGIRGLKGQPGIQPGEEITEEDLAAFFGNDGEVLGVRINGPHCWIEFAEAAGAQSALQKDGTESGGHHLRISQSKTPIRSNGYAAGRAKQEAARAAAAKAAAAAAPSAPDPGAVAATPAPMGGARPAAPARQPQMSPADIVAAINAAIDQAMDPSKAAATATAVAPTPASASVPQMQQVPPPPMQQVPGPPSTDGKVGGPKRLPTTVLKLRGLPYDVGVDAIVEFFQGPDGDGPVTVNPENVLMTLTPEGRPSGQAFVEFASTQDSAIALTKNKATIGSRYVELFPSSREEAARNVA